MLANELIADSRLVFIQRKYEESLKLVKAALSQESSNSDAHQCAGNAYSSLREGILQANIDMFKTYNIKPTPLPNGYVPNVQKLIDKGILVFVEKIDLVK